MVAEPRKLEGLIREIAVGQLSRVGGRAWAEREVDTLEFIEMAEKIMAAVLNDAIPKE